MSPVANASPRPGKAPVVGTQFQTPGSASVVTAADESPEEEAMLAAGLKAHKGYSFVGNSHMKNIAPLGSQPPVPPAPTPEPVAVAEPPAPSAPTPDPAILSLASNNDLNVATLAREANKAMRDEPPENEEVVISLH
jgi:hypothetical protein